MSQGQLAKELRKGRLAKMAYDSYLREYLEDSKQAVFDSFELADSEADNLVQLKYCLEAIKSLENTVKQDIISGELAEKQLENQR